MNNCILLPSLKFGMTVVVITSPEEMPPGTIRLVIERDIINGEQHLGINYPDKAVSSLWAGPPDEIRALRALYREEFLFQRPAVSVVTLGDYDDNWLQGIGFQAVAQQMNRETGLITFFYESSGVTPTESTNLGKLCEMTKAKECHFVIFLIAQGKFNPASIKSVVDRLIVVEPCEADPDWEYAVAITAIRRGYFSSSPGKLFCQFNQVPDAFPEVTWEPFINASPEVRAQWHMHKKGSSMTDIAEAFGCDKSTVSRNLKRIPKKLDSWLSDDQVESRFDMTLEHEATQPKATKAKTGCKVETIEEEYDSFWDAPDADEDDVPKQQPKRKKTRW